MCQSITRKGLPNPGCCHCLVHVTVNCSPAASLNPPCHWLLAPISSRFSVISSDHCGLHNQIKIKNGKYRWWVSFLFFLFYQGVFSSSGLALLLLTAVPSHRDHFLRRKQTEAAGRFCTLKSGNLLSGSLKISFPVCFIMFSLQGTWKHLMCFHLDISQSTAQGYLA